ncbi:hypothetical protein BOX15_Mlig030329g1 [Macrostomum lignano]|uniref:Ubiquitin-conjugating enzyme E2 Z n=1 Tax=Macrostomum lignano TaxID=282301 RepID=A0A267DV78_9PLAT|nr:hypothetical protein BOX15_Mlig030329g1 [Macrostomum lignano]
MASGSGSSSFEKTQDFKKFLSQSRSDWDPEFAPNAPLPASCLARVKNELVSIFNDPIPGIFVVQDDADLGKVHALLTGPFETPYEGGFFYIIMRVPPQYPNQPPRARLVTTGNGQVRFNPNLYKNGKICLSILGTWQGPGWTPVMSLRSVLLSIQTLLNERPYHNEPGFEVERQQGDAQAYYDIITHETIRAAVCDMLERRVSNLPKPFYQVMQDNFPDYYQHYTEICRRNQAKDGTQMRDPFGDSRPKFNYTNLLARLEAIYKSCVSSSTAAAAGGSGSNSGTIGH